MTDTAPCIAEGEHIKSQRHLPASCPMTAQTTTAAPLTYEDRTGEHVEFRRVRLEVSVELYAYVPVDFKPFSEGTTLGDDIESDIKDALEHRAPHLSDWEEGDSLLITEDVSVSVNALEDDADPEMTSELLNQWVGGRSAETF